MVLRLRLLSAALSAFALGVWIVAQQAPALADQVLVNGGFEAGTSGWEIAGSQAATCTARSGNAALALSRSGGTLVTATQHVANSAGLGPYQLSGYMKLAAGGSISLRVRLDWKNANGDTLAPASVNLSPAGSYQSFSLSSGVGPTDATVLIVQFELLSAGTLCIDDVSLEGPPPVTSTTIPTATATPVVVDTPTRTPTLAPATHTPRPPTATRTPASTKAPNASATPGSDTTSGASSGVARAIAAAVVNGGFEDGLAPWLKVGGELALTTESVHSGAQAAILRSSTTSTKWAYQVVAVSGGGSYEFEGYLRPGAGAAQCYLRISWYSSAEGSGSALGNTDSTDRVSGPAADFVYLTTGSVAAPPAARSARVRAVMAPVGVTPAVMYLDDLAFGPSSEAARDDAVAPASASDDAVESPGAGGDGLVSSSSPAAGAPITAAAVPARQEVLSASANLTPSADNIVLRRATEDGGTSGIKYVGLAAVFLAGVCAAGAIAYQRRHAG